MAESKDVVINEDNLCCSICLEVYVNTRALPCLHSFCRLCLVNYAEKLIGSKNKRKCEICSPLCRKDAKCEIKQFDNNADKWVESLPVNFILVSILSSKRTKMTDKETNCVPCFREEIKVPASHYCYECSENVCESCVKLHKKIKSLSNHKLCNLGDGESNLAQFDFLKSLTKCPEHQAEEVRYICKDHDQLCCNECAIVRHRKCDYMISIADELSKLEISDQDLDFRLGEILDGSKKLTEYETKHQSTVKASKNQIRVKLASLKRKIDEAFCKMEKTILQDADDRSANIMKKSKSQLESIKTLRAEVNRSRDNLRIVHNKGEKLHLFLVERHLKTELKRHEDKLQNLRSDSSVKSITLIDDVSEQDLMKTIASCSHLEELTSSAGVPSSTEMCDITLTGEPVLISEMKLTYSSSRERACVWVDNFVVIGLQEMKQLQLFDINKESLKYNKTENVSSQPWPLKKVDDSRFAVCYRQNNTIEIMKISKGTFETLNTFSTDTAVWDISYNKLQRQIIGFSRSGTIDVFQLDGTKSGSVPLRSEMCNVVKYAYGICFDTGTNLLYISSYGRHKVVAVKLDGTLVFEYTHQHLHYPWQPDIDAEGNIYIPCVGGIHQIDRNGKLLREIKFPGNGLCVCFDNSKTNFIVSHNTPSGIRMYNLK
ncbi:E3 ubiquitin-protein ligase TRIM71-like [Mercenaria mercenaria]|uniref:E3 ubiquitin-protein ligase TRIM71-like n=1 Tax=Mercenaria mercenaria TaxID=6596 RepID=UPI00234E9745|nr:E3 ubiquitin-protein ligase TRIM71-like [Mercenaria mercenaria]